MATHPKQKTMQTITNIIQWSLIILMWLSIIYGIGFRRVMRKRMEKATKLLHKTGEEITKKYEILSEELHQRVDVLSKENNRLSEQNEMYKEKLSNLGFTDLNM